jgi:hypothetical protein
MNESEWLADNDPRALVAFVRDRTSARKLRLWACACARRIWPLISEEIGRRAVVVAERFAEGLVGEAELRAVADVFYPCGFYNASYSHPAVRAAHCALYLEHVPEAANWAARARKSHERAAEQTAQIALVHHVFGNPFQPAAVLTPLPPSIPALAAALYAGQDCGFALHDALLDAGDVSLAGHFRTPDHPRGCWALDLLLGKE